MKKIISNNKFAYSVIISMIPALQATLDTFNAANLQNESRVYVSAILMLALIILQGIQTYFNPEIKNTALWISIVAFIGYVAGGIIDNLQIIQLSEENASVIRLAFTLIVVFSTSIVKQYNTLIGNQPEDPRNNPPK